MGWKASAILWYGGFAQRYMVAAERQASRANLGSPISPAKTSTPGGTRALPLLWIARTGLPLDESKRVTARPRGPIPMTTSALEFSMETSLMCSDRAVHSRETANGLELSSPAKAHSDYRAELAGSAPASG